MRQFARPVVVVSKCLGFEPVRYNGGIIRSDFIQNLRNYAELRTVCPEVAIGLGVPRPPIRTVDDGSGARLFQPETGKDLTSEMQAFALDFVGGIRDVDGFVLKARSPSCGITGVKVYPHGTKTMPKGKAEGFFGGRVAKAFPNIPVEDEEALDTPAQREHFLTRVFMLADFRETQRFGTLEALRCFHLRNRMLLLLYCNRSVTKLNTVLSHGPKWTAARVMTAYSAELYQALHRLPRSDSAASVLKMAFAPFEAKVTSRERALFVSSLVKYQEKRVPMRVPLALIRANLARFEDPDLASQTLLEPYPDGLVEITESGAAR